MSKKTRSQMEAELMDKIEKTKLRLNQLHQKHQLEIGALAYQHGLQQLDHKQLNHTFATIAKELHNGHA